MEPGQIASVLLGATVVGTVGYAVYRHFVHRVTVFDHQFALHWRGGRRQGTLEPGRHTLTGTGHFVLTLERRTQGEPIFGQEVLTSDGATVRASVLVRYRIADPVAFFDAWATAIDTPRTGCYVSSYLPTYSLAHEAAHAALRDAIGSRTLEACLTERLAIAEELTRRGAEGVQGTGIEIESVALRDLVPGSDVRRAMGDLHVAQHTARANLERARAEAAVLRSMANNARTLQNNPALVQLKLLQAIETGKAQVVIGADAWRALQPSESDSGLDEA